MQRVRRLKAASEGRLFVLAFGRHPQNAQGISGQSEPERARSQQRIGIAGGSARGIGLDQVQQAARQPPGRRGSREDTLQIGQCHTFAGDDGLDAQGAGQGANVGRVAAAESGSPDSAIFVARFRAVSSEWKLYSATMSAGVGTAPTRVRTLIVFRVQMQQRVPLMRGQAEPLAELRVADPPARLRSESRGAAH